MPRWATFTDKRLLAMRLCDLGLSVEGSWLVRPIKELYTELEAAKLTLRPHLWLSQEWFSPDGIPGIAIPFFLAHPRLARLERKLMGEVEGGRHDQCLKILRHEAGHALQHGFLLHKKPRWREVFGPSSQPYPDAYRPNPRSKSYVLHLELWYAQSHPDEDFAETFAEWLRPGSRWRSRYQGWPALQKLEYVDTLAKSLAGKAPLVRSKRTVEPLSSLRLTLGEYYEQKRARYAHRYPEDYDADLRRLFSGTRGETAAKFMRRHRAQVRTLVARFAGEHVFALDQVWKEMSGRAQELRLHVPERSDESAMQLAVVLAMQTVNYLHKRAQAHPM
ncbi:MAG: putative zinc-binding metallopeptidase [Deltaproteobacteria bacterium]|nr:putative zinc-binding metallopeptidase [Deltaproteobacteria bacterium]